MKRQCDCAGGCSAPHSDGLSRREFLWALGAGTATALWGADNLASEPESHLAAWKRQLFEPGAPRVYRSDQHTDARMHLGGIGTGNFQIGADGQLTTWQLFNTLRDGDVPFYFAIHAGRVAKLLQTAGGPDWPRVQQIEMTGDYPLAHLRFRDADLPVRLELTAFSPFAPLDTRLSSMPLAAFVFKLTNPNAEPQTVSLAAFLQNPIGYEASGPNRSHTHPNFGGNVNEPVREGRAAGLWLRAEPGREPTLDPPVSLYAAPDLKLLKSPPPDRPKNLTLEWLERLPAADKLADAAHTVVWLEEASVDTSAAWLRLARDAVQAGATLVFSGRSQPLLEAYAAWTGGKPVAEVTERPDILFEDFEGSYEKWQVEGEAFGKAPARGTLPNQQPVTGFLGQGLVNSYLGGDDSRGRLLSQPFRIERHFIRFRIGGGGSKALQIRLLVDGKTVRATTSAKEEEQLVPASWDVRQFAGKTARLEIVDHKRGPWGHINVDHIVFSDAPGDRAVMTLLEELLPARFNGMRPDHTGQPGLNQLQFESLALLPEARETTTRRGLRLLVRAVGKGKVVLAAGPILEPALAEFSRHRQQAYGVLCDLVGARFGDSGGILPTAPGFGSLALAALAARTSVWVACDNLDEVWQRFVATGAFQPLSEAAPSRPTPAGRTVHGAVAASVTVPPGGSAEVPFLLTWHFPNQYNTHRHATEGVWMGCHYATRWPDARAVLREAAAQFASLRERTELFRKTFYDSTLPWWLLDCVTANAATIRHAGVVFRIANGDLYGWEGSNGCCQPTCTHVWGYEQTLARLFPDLEREMRRIDFQHQQRPDGGINNRTDVPSPPRPTGEHPFADGHASCILKAYREALNSPEDDFLRAYWPPVKRAVEYLLGRDAASHGGQPAGYLEDDQWNTYDEALHGVTTFISGYYLAALRAGEEWAKRVSDSAAAQRFHAVFEKGRDKLVELCWNGEYFQQHLPDYDKRVGEVGPGCMSDQLLGQWWAHQLGLGYLFPKEMVRSALRAIFRYNWKPDLTGWRHAPRAFAGARDKGLIICTWPKGGRPPQVMLYSDEVWTGVEYQVAAHLIYEGLIEEGLAIVKGARERYDGAPRPPIPRNPWNEIECGGHYARAMSSGSLLLALSGWEYDGPQRRLRLAPRFRPEDFRCFFIGPEGWGTAAQNVGGGVQTVTLSVVRGRLSVRTLGLNRAEGVAGTRVTTALAGKTLPARLAREGDLAHVSWAREVAIHAGAALTVVLA